MDLLAVFALLLLIGAPIGIIGAYAVVRGPRAFASILGFSQQAQEPWPRGVQEEDPPPRWRVIGPRARLARQAAGQSGDAPSGSREGDPKA